MNSKVDYTDYRPEHVIPWLPVILYMLDIISANSLGD